MLARTPPDAALVGVDEETALVAIDADFVVRGKKSVWRIDRDGTRSQFKAGERLELATAAPR